VNPLQERLLREHLGIETLHAGVGSWAIMGLGGHLGELFAGP
jgi:hypothetical protein